MFSHMLTQELELQRAVAGRVEAQVAIAFEPAVYPLEPTRAVPLYRHVYTYAYERVHCHVD